MVNRLPEEAFSYYVSLGPERSYQAVADKFDVSKTTVANHATDEKWQTRIDEIEKKAREATDASAIESIESMNSRHLKMIKVIQTKSLEALKSMPLNSAMAAVRALEASVKLERTIRGEPSDRTAVSVEDAIKREISSWLTSVEEKGGMPAEAANDDSSGS
ncbi:MAG: hypothetical protein HY292_07770 [Planctomycetes bacterium]|nr:hypothetical protein [Planctomycetota bacterium]